MSTGVGVFLYSLFRVSAFHNNNIMLFYDITTSDVGRCLTTQWGNFYPMDIPETFILTPQL